MLTEALSFDERTAERVLLATGQLSTIPHDATPEQIERLAARTGFSRFPVTDPAGRLVGYLHLKDALETKHVHRTRPIAPRWIRPLPTVAAGDPLHTVLEDVLEELVGEIRDETQHAVEAGPRRRA